MRRRIAVVVGLYVLVMAVVVWGTFRARDAALEQLTAPGAHAAWSQWRGDVASGSVEADASVARRTPESAEPPWLVLMRDYFGTCLAAAVVFSTLLFAVTTFFVMGMRRT